MKQTPPYDKSQHLCSWIITNSNSSTSSNENENKCVYNDPKISLKVTIIISVMVTLFGAIINMVVDFLFIEILSAPTVENLKSTSKNNKSQISQTTTTTSILPTTNKITPTSIQNNNNNQNTNQPANRISQQNNHKSQSFRETLVSNTETRIVSSRFNEIHSLAMKSMSQSNLSTKNENNRKTRISIRSNRKTLLNNENLKNLKVNEIRVANNLNNNNIQKQKQKQNNNKNNENENEVEELFECLLLDIQDQRETLKKRNEREVFDSLWG